MMIILVGFGNWYRGFYIDASEQRITFRFTRESFENTSIDYGGLGIMIRQHSEILELSSRRTNTGYIETYKASWSGGSGNYGGSFLDTSSVSILRSAYNKNSPVGRDNYLGGDWKFNRTK